jgi:hypothetical protein
VAVDWAGPNARHDFYRRSVTPQAVAVGTPTPRHRRRSGQRSRQAHMEQRRIAHAAVRGDAPTDGTTAPTGEHAAAGPQFPYGMQNTTVTYASSASTNMAACEDLPGHHLLAVRNLIATTNDESYHGSASELPPATSRGYAEWDFSGVWNPVMFQRFLDAANYWFDYSNDSNIGSYDPARECFVVVVDNHADGVNGIGAGDGDAPQNPGPSVPRNPGPSAPHLADGRHRHRRAAGPSTRARGQARGRVPASVTPAHHHRRRSLGVR